MENLDRRGWRSPRPPPRRALQSPVCIRKKHIAVPIACKIGTAEFGHPDNDTHAWFTVFGPIPDSFVPDDIRTTEGYVSGEPEISVTVLVEGAGEGSTVAAPIAKEIFEEWFGR